MVDGDEELVIRWLVVDSNMDLIYMLAEDTIWSPGLHRRIQWRSMTIFSTVYTVILSLLIRVEIPLTFVNTARVGLYVAKYEM